MKKIRFTVFPLLLALSGVACEGSSDRLTAGAMAYHKGDYKTALRMWRPLAKQGNDGAQLNLGQLYRKGQGVPQNYKEAVKWYQKAAEQGNSIAQNNLGYMYATGRGVPPDHLQAHIWFIIASESGGRHATFNKKLVAKVMTPADTAEFNMKLVAEVMTPAGITESQVLAREWMERHQ